MEAFNGDHDALLYYPGTKEDQTSGEPGALAPGFFRSPNPGALTLARKIRTTGSCRVGHSNGASSGEPGTLAPGCSRLRKNPGANAPGSPDFLSSFVPGV